MTGANVTEATAEMTDESRAEMRLLTHVVGSAARVHGALAQNQIDEILDHTMTPLSPPEGVGQPIEN